MIKNFRKLTLVTISVFCLSGLNAQFGIGITAANDLYNRYSNPEDGLAHKANGSAILNLAVGPKIWLGGEDFSFSVESLVNWGIFGLSTPDYKGLGNLAFPIMAKLNFAGLSGTNKEGRFGFSIGGGIQYNRTEIYGLKDSFEDIGVTRNYFRTYVVQAGYGFGISGFGLQFFTRYGFNPDLDGANTLNVGLQWDFNFVKLKKISDPASEL